MISTRHEESPTPGRVTIWKREAGDVAATPAELERLEGQLYGILEREVMKLRPMSMQVKKAGRKISAPRLKKLKAAIDILDTVIAKGAGAPADEAYLEQIMNAAVLIKAAAAAKETRPMPTTSTRQRVTDRIEALAIQKRSTTHMTREAAYAQALTENPDLYDEYEAACARGEAPEAQVVAPASVAKGEDSAVWARICALADEMVSKSATPWTREAAIAKVILDNPTLYARYEAEKAGR